MRKYPTDLAVPDIIMYRLEQPIPSNTENEFCSLLMTTCSLLALGENCKGKIQPHSEDDIAWLEGRIDALQAELKPVEFFTIPGGCELSSLCHVCRTVCRRTERRAIEAAENYEIDHSLLIVLNRLSDYLYALCRTISERLGAEEVLWRP